MNKQSGGRRTALAFSIAGSLLTITFFAFINFSTGSRFPWFIYPTFAVLWWPVGVFFSRWRSAKGLSLVGSLLIIGLLFLTNYLTSWGYPWFLYPSFAVIWWPLAAFFGPKSGKILSVLGCIAIIAFAAATNYITSPAYIWWYYPAFAVIWWPLSVLFARPGTDKMYSILGALILLGFIIEENLVRTPEYPWTLFAVYPILMWPVCTLLGSRARSIATAAALSSLGIVYYTALNVFVFPGFPWAIFPAYCLLWWPMGIAFAGRGQTLLFAVGGTVLSAALFIATNAISSPHTIWAVYPIFALLWWPLSVYYFRYKPNRIKNRGN